MLYLRARRPDTFNFQLNRTSGHGVGAGNSKLKTACCHGEGGEWDEKENVPPLRRVSFSVDLWQHLG
jgi:hypothetical protein